jgi:uncharacterized protein (DUF885 family)
MRILLTVFLCFSALCQCQPADPSSTQQSATPPLATDEQQPAQTESERLNAWLDQAYLDELDFSPLSKTFLGIKDEDYGKFDDMSLDAERAVLRWKRRSVETMKSEFDYDKLDPSAKISFDLWAYQLTVKEASAKFPLHGYAFEQMSGLQGFVPTLLMQFHSVETEADLLAYNDSIIAAARGLRQMLERAEKAADIGIRAPAFAYEKVIQQSQQILVGQPFDQSEFDSNLLADAKQKASKLVESGAITQKRADTLVERISFAYAGQFKSAFEEIILFHQTALQDLDAPMGVGSLPDGHAYYDERLSYWTTTDMNADDIHTIGLAEVARLRSEMETIKAKVGFDGTLQDFFEFVRTDPQFYYPNTDEGRQAYIDDATAAIEEIKTSLPNFFGTIPKTGLIVKRVEAFREIDGAPQHYYPGTPDGTRPGIYYAHLSDMTAMPKNQLEVIAYHEGLPGHHMQISISQEMTGLPKFRSQASFGVFQEGWALYTELLAKEMGAYKDPYSDFGRLTTEMWRAVRLVVDTGIHAKGWTVEETVAYFLANTPEPEASVRAEVERYFVLPGQATSYKIGMMKIMDLRKQAELELGDKFDIREFHDVVLTGGALPLAVLEQRINAWILKRNAS